MIMLTRTSERLRFVTLNVRINQSTVGLHVINCCVLEIADILAQTRPLPLYQDFACKNTNELSRKVKKLDIIFPHFTEPNKNTDYRFSWLKG